jgi:hypothetical protein
MTCIEFRDKAWRLFIFWGERNDCLLWPFEFQYMRGGLASDTFAVTNWPHRQHLGKPKINRWQSLYKSDTLR